MWLKRDLRLQDHLALHHALQEDLPVLLLYIFEPSLLKDKHYSERHWNFVKESLQHLQEQLNTHTTEILVVEDEVVFVFKTLIAHIKIHTLFSHQETGLRITYDRDIALEKFAITLKKEQPDKKFGWVEFCTNGVQRGLRNRKGWSNDWEWFMNQPQLPFQPKKGQFVDLQFLSELKKYFSPQES